MNIHPNDEILEISYHEKIKKYEKSAAKEFKAILNEAVESSPKSRCPRSNTADKYYI